MNRPSRSVVALMGIVGWLGAGTDRAIAADGPKVWAIVVGINKYEDTADPPMRRCDPRRLGRSPSGWRTAGWDNSATSCKMNDLGKPGHGLAAEKYADLLPTRENLDWAVTEWLGHRVKKNDIVVIYFAGQATARAPKPGEPAGRAYLLPIDARGADIAGSGWSLDDALDKAKALAEKKARVVLWLDTSTLGRGQVGMVPEKDAPSGQDWLRTLTRWEGVTAWLAADGRPAPEGRRVHHRGPELHGPAEAHNLLGCLKGLRDDKALVARGFRTMGGVGPAVSLWSGGALVIEEAVPELIVQAGHGDRVTSVIVTSDNARIITASMDSTVRAWKLGERQPAMVRVLTDPFVGVKCLTLDRDGRLLLAGDGAGGIVGWDMTQDRPKPIYGPPEHEEAVASLAFLPDSLNFVSLDKGGRSVLWDATGGVIKKTRDFSDESICRLASAARPDRRGQPRGGRRGPEDRRARLAAHLRRPAGKRLARFDGPGGRISALDLTDDGRRMVTGDDRGRVNVLDLPGRSLALDRKFAGEIHLARLSRSGLLVVADDRSLRLVEPKAGGADIVLVDGNGQAVPGEVDRSAFSDDGRWLAACTEIEGRVLLWQIGDPVRPIPVAIPEHDAPGLSPAFSPDGRTLVMGDQDGGIRAWTLDDGPAGPKVEVLARIKAARGKVATLSPSGSGKLLLEVTKDDLALIWYLEQDRGCKPLPGSWTSGSFLPDESKLILSRTGNDGGDLVQFDRSSNAPMPVKYLRPVDVAGKPFSATFGRVVVSKTGKWVAAAAAEYQLPLACVWEVATGKLVYTARVHDGGLTALDFSPDEAFLLTASEDGRAKLWPLTDQAIDLRSSTIFSGSDENEDPAFTAARVSPGDPHRVATGTRGGVVQLWSWEKGKPKPQRLGDPFKVNGAVNASVFSPDGRWLAVSGALNKSIRFWAIPESGAPKPVDFLPRPHHGEQVGALTAWPNGTMIVSGGDDTAVRFWDLKDHALIGTLVAQGHDARAADWLAFTPEGLFDGSMPGEAMVKWRVGETIVTLQQSEDTHHVFQLATAIGQGTKPPGPKLVEDGPQLKIDSPSTDRVVDAREVEMTIWSGDARPSALRLYQNGVPVRGEADFAPGSSPNFLTTKVILRKGENRFYAMASKPAAVDGQSNLVTLRYDGPEPPGRVHTLAIGVSRYDKRPLKYAHADAQRIAEYLQSQGVNGNNRPGERIVLVDNQVTEPAIEDAFRQLRDAVKGKPEDTVVLFLAGHTDTDAATDQFCLLLPQFPFDRAGPVAAQPNLGVAMRGNLQAGLFQIKVDDPDVLPYVVLYNRLTRLEALQRLIIVDACQAGAILEDKAVQNIQRLVEKGSRKVRNSYLLAARRGEPANEADALEHGLLTYTLLHGLKAPGLKLIPAALGGFPGRPSADLNLDGIVTSDELTSYTEDALPRLAQMFPQVVMRAGNPLPAPVPAEAGPPELEKRLKLQSTEASFPLISIPIPPK